jgi:hypothetical protein
MDASTDQRPSLQKGKYVNRIRGIVMLLAAALAFWKGWQLHRGEPAVIACGLGMLALTLGVWHLFRSENAQPKRT